MTRVKCPWCFFFEKDSHPLWWTIQDVDFKDKYGFILKSITRQGTTSRTRERRFRGSWRF
jgi:hypothetical protein